LDPVSVRMARAALVWLAVGFLLGALMLSDAQLPGSWRLWFAPTHGHILFVGWFLQFAVGIAYWLLPRTRTEEYPLGYNERAGMTAMLVLNASLGLRVVFEPTMRMGYQTRVSDVILLVSAIGHVLAIGIIVVQLWGRIIPRRVLRDRSGSNNTKNAPRID
jgi:hypothetical protein